MADKIQLSLEYTINELDQLVKQGLFTKTEIRNIIKKRRFYEYKFEKKDVTKQDYFKAIRYEKILDKKRKQRKKEKKIKQSNYFEFTFVRRAVYIFQKLLRKFKNSEDIWMEFFYFLIKNQCYNVINREIGKCLSLFPQNIEFWKIAAYNEHENNCNSLTARTLFQKCIRMNKDNVEAYVEYFIFELKFVEKLIMRDKILKGDEEKKLKFVDDVEEEKKVEENKKKFEQIELSDDVLGLRIPEIIWKNALENFQNKGIKLDEITIRFLESLYKYGKALNIKNLKKKMKDFLLESGNNNNNFCKVKVLIINASLQIYSRNDLLNKLNIKYNKLLENEINNTSNLHFIIYNLINYINDIYLTNFDKEEGETVKFIIFQNIVKYIKREEFYINPQSNENKEILKFLIQSHLNFSTILNEYKINLKEIVINILSKQILDQVIDVNYLSLLQNLLTVQNLNSNQILDEIYNLFDKITSKSCVILKLAEIVIGMVFDDINTVSDYYLISSLKKLKELYKKSLNRTISSNKLFVEYVCTNFIRSMKKSKEFTNKMQIIFDFITDISKEYLVNYREIFSKIIINKEEIPLVFINKII